MENGLEGRAKVKEENEEGRAKRKRQKRTGRAQSEKGRASEGKSGTAKRKRKSEELRAPRTDTTTSQPTCSSSRCLVVSALLTVHDASRWMRLIAR